MLKLGEVLESGGECSQVVVGKVEDFKVLEGRKLD